MRIAVFFLAIVVVPAFGLLIMGVLKDLGFGNLDFRNWISPAWIIWGLMLIAELATLAMRRDLQQKLERAGKLPHFPAEG